MTKHEDDSYFFDPLVTVRDQPNDVNTVTCGHADDIRLGAKNGDVFVNADDHCSVDDTFWILAPDVAETLANGLLLAVREAREQRRRMRDTELDAESEGART